MGCIYKITNVLTGKIYIGQTAGTIEHRFKEHKRNAKNGVPYYLYKAMRKYGEENFEIQELKHCDDSELNKKERYWISLLDSCNNGYNMTLGGEGRLKYRYQELAQAYIELGSERAVCEKFCYAPVTVQKACESNNIEILPSGSTTKMQWDSGLRENQREQMRKLGKSLKGKKLSQEHRQKLSESKMGKYCGENNPMYGKNFSEEHKEKLSQNSAWAKPVKCIETNMVYSSACKAAKAVGLKSSAGVSKCCINEQKTAGGYHWQFC